MANKLKKFRRTLKTSTTTRFPSRKNQRYASKPRTFLGNYKSMAYDPLNKSMAYDREVLKQYRENIGDQNGDFESDNVD